MQSLQAGNFFGTVGIKLYQPGLIYCVTGYAPGDVEADAPHFHEHTQLYLTTRGGSLERRTGKISEILPGQVRFYHPGEWHQNIRKGRVREGLNVELEDSFLVSHSLPSNLADATSSASLQFALLAIYRELMAPDPDTAESVLSLLLAGLSETAPASKVPPRWTTIIRDILHDRWAEQVTLNELSVATGINLISISKHFPRYFGCTLGEYRRRLKAANAIAMVASGKYSLTEIAYACGFADQSHFTRVFRGYVGWSPGEWFTLSA